MAKYRKGLYRALFSAPVPVSAVLRPDPGECCFLRQFRDRDGLAGIERAKQARSISTNAVGRLSRMADGQDGG